MLPLGLASHCRIAVDVDISVVACDGNAVVVEKQRALPARRGRRRRGLLRE
jgi:hypothetical protein